MNLAKRKKKLWFDFVNLRLEIMTSTVREKSISSRVCGLIPPHSNEVLCDLLPADREHLQRDFYFRLNIQTSQLFYQTRNIKQLSSWRIAFMTDVYDLCWKVESFIVCLLVLDRKHFMVIWDLFLPQAVTWPRPGPSWIVWKFTTQWMKCSCQIHN